MKSTPVLRNKKKVFFSIAFVAYTILMLWLLFGQRTVQWTNGYDFALLAENINLIPFRTIAEFLHDLHGGERSHAMINLLGNVIMFVPLGFFIPAVFKKAEAFRNTMLWSVLAIVCIEIIQLFTLLGSLDIDDVILNLVGAALGYGIYRLLLRREE